MAVLGALTGLVVALVVGWAMIRVGGRLGIVDEPDEDLKTHTGSPVPLGGSAVMLGAFAGLYVAGVLDLALIAASLIVWVVGLADDVRRLSPWLRLLGTVAAGLVLVVVSDSTFEPVVAGFWVVAVVLVVNAINLFDGLDALAGSVMTVAVLGIAVFGATQGAADPWVLLAIVAALFGFLTLNRPPARLYLGDNGAYVVGVLAVWAAMWASTDRMGGVVAVAVVGMPLIELGVTVFRRGLSGSPFFSGDRDHTYDRLHHQGLSEAGVAVVFSIAQVLWVAILIGSSVVFGDLVAAVTALALGVLVAAILGVRAILVQS